MSMKGVTTCAVQTCSLPVSGYNNLCEVHRLSGFRVEMNGDTMVITVWYAEHLDEQGIILLNDWALGYEFGGGSGFEASLAKLGFRNVRNLVSIEELEDAKRLRKGMKAARMWTGSSLPCIPLGDS